MTADEIADRTRRAVDLACEVHRGVFRRNGDPYIVHPLAVARIVAELGADPDTVVAALLHDVVHDAHHPVAEIRAGFGDAVAQILQEFVSLSRTRLDLSDSKRHVHELSHVDHRAIMVKLADRLHNMRTIDGLTEDRQYLKARETTQVIAPVARLVGLGVVAVQLDELSTQTLHRHGASRSASAVESWNADAGLRVTRTFLHLAARLLMPRPSCARWLAEWDGEITALPDRRERLRFTVELLFGLPRMAAAAHTENRRESRR